MWCSLEAWVTTSASSSTMSSSGKNTQSNHKEGSCVSYMQNGSFSKRCSVLRLFICLSGFLWLWTWIISITFSEGTTGGWRDRKLLKETLLIFYPKLLRFWKCIAMPLLPLTSGGHNNFICLPNTDTCYELLQHFSCLLDTPWRLTVGPHRVTLMAPVKQWLIKL